MFISMIFKNKFYLFNDLLHSFIPYFAYLALLKFNLLFSFIINFYLISLSFFIKNNIFLCCDRLIDIIVSDNLFKGIFRFELTYIFYSTLFACKLGLKILTNDFLKVFSVSSINFYFPSASWLEREAWDMFGLRFLFHKELIRILSDYGFKGYPMRKDFPLYGYIDLLYSDIASKCIMCPIILIQTLCQKNYENP